MKKLFQLAGMLLVSTFLFTSCKKDSDGAKAFNANNPVGYIVAGTYRHSFIYSKVDQPLLIKFLENNKIEYTTFSNTVTYPYKMSNDTFYINNNDLEILVIKNEKVLAYYNATDIVSYKLTLQRVPAANQLEGKTFVGKYYNPNGTVLHNSFFYTYVAGQKQQAGYTVGTPVRTNEYTNIGNIASRNEPYAGHLEFTLLMDGKLYSNYYNNGTLQYGLLDKQ